MNNRKKQIGDSLICFAVFLQPVLILFQHVLIGVYHMDISDTTVYRVVFTAIPMVIAILISAYRNFTRLFDTYTVVLLILLITVSLFPENEPFVMTQGVRFLLPVVIPSALCLTTVYEIETVWKMMKVLSWVATVLVLFYVVTFFAGMFFIEDYDMSFSYACLMPMLVLYSQKRPVSIAASIFIFLSVIAIGSRGAAIIFVAFVVLDFFRNKNKWRFLLLIVGALFIVLFPMFSSVLDSVGISSRTITMFNSGNVMDESSRTLLYNYFVSQLLDNPLLGIGLFGDRIFTNGSYCHNILLEVCLNWGVVLGPILIIIMAYNIIKTYINSNQWIKDLYLIFIFIGILPFMFSGSYLIDNGFAFLIGMTVLLSSKGHQKNMSLA